MAPARAEQEERFVTDAGDDALLDACGAPAVAASTAWMAQRSMWSLEPASPELDAFRRLTLRVCRQLGKSVGQVRDQRGLLVRAGFSPVRTTASCVAAGDADRTRRAARGHINVLRSARFARAAVESGAASVADLDAMAEALRRWGERPDAVEVVLWRASVG
jgi:hypothetical protein